MREWNPEHHSIKFGGREMSGWLECNCEDIADQQAATINSTDNKPGWRHQPDSRSRGTLSLALSSPDVQFCRDMVRKPLNVVIADNSLEDGYTGLDAKIVSNPSYGRTRDGEPTYEIKWEAARTKWEASATQHETTGV